MGKHIPLIARIHSSVFPPLSVSRTFDSPQDSSSDSQLGQGKQNDSFSSQSEQSKPLNRTIPSSDAEIESAGTAFLDDVGKRLGLRLVSC